MQVYILRAESLIALHFTQTHTHTRVVRAKLHTQKVACCPHQTHIFLLFTLYIYTVKEMQREAVGAIYEDACLTRAGTRLARRVSSATLGSPNLLIGQFFILLLFIRREWLL